MLLFSSRQLQPIAGTRNTSQIAPRVKQIRFRCRATPMRQTRPGSLPTRAQAHIRREAR
jgi:hypothetical protein